MGPAAAAEAMADPASPRWASATPARPSSTPRWPTSPGARGGQDPARAPGPRGPCGAVTLLRGHDVAVDALPARASPLAIHAALEAGTPVVTLSARGAATIPDLAEEATRRGGLVVLGCGLEPGLTEILARRLAERLDRVDELHIQCGGVPERPAPPLGYKIVFGGRALPLREAPALAIQDGRVISVPRYSGVETVIVPGVGELEAWHEGFATSLLEIPALRELGIGTQKTLRWPGYAAKVSVLRDLGLLSESPVAVDGSPVIPKQLLDAVLYPRVRLDPGERDLALLRVDAIGERAGQPSRAHAEMVDRWTDGFTAMARTTSFTASIVARMIARGEVTARGAQRPETIVAGALVDRLLRELRAHGIRVTLSEEPSGPARGAGTPRATPDPSR